MGSAGQPLGKELPFRNGHAEQTGGVFITEQAERDDEHVADVIAPFGGHKHAALGIERVCKRTNQHAVRSSLRPVGTIRFAPAEAADEAAAQAPLPGMGILPDSCSVSIHHFAPFVTTGRKLHVFFEFSFLFTGTGNSRTPPEKRGDSQKHKMWYTLYLVWYAFGEMRQSPAILAHF